MFTLELWEFHENEEFLDARRVYFRRKRSVQQAIFERKLLIAIISGKVQGVGGGGENPFPTHEFFIYFFLFSRHYAALQRHACNYFSVTQLLPNIAHMPQSRSFSLDRLPPPHHPFPTTPITQSVEEFSAYTDRLRFSIFCFGYLGPLVESLGQIFYKVSHSISF